MNSTDRYDSLIRFYAQQNQLDWTLVKAQLQQESRLNPNAYNAASGAEGMAQFLPATFLQEAKALQLKNPSPYNPEHAIACQCHYMNKLLAIFSENEEQALAAYNWGPANLRKCIADYQDNWTVHIPRETFLYIQRIEDLKTYWKEKENQ